MIEFKILKKENLNCPFCSRQLIANDNNLNLYCTNCGREIPGYENKKQVKDEQKNNKLFGYGSLILPTSILSRYYDFNISTSEIYSKEKFRGYVRGEALLKLHKSNLKFSYGKIYGYKRKYSFDSKRGGKMLTCQKTGDKRDFVNGIIIENLSDKHLQEITSTESGYRKEKLEDINYYDTKENEEDEVILYLPVEESNKNNYEKRNRIYHNRILVGIKMIQDIKNKKIMREFYKDFQESFH